VQSSPKRKGFFYDKKPIPYHFDQFGILDFALIFFFLIHLIFQKLNSLGGSMQKKTKRKINTQ